MNLLHKSMKWTEIIAVTSFLLLIFVTVIGNLLVILAVLTTKRLRTVTNCFVMSLAVADLLVGVFVMPPAIALRVIGSWNLGWTLCDIWVSFDILLCTASILSLCAISLDRYLAVTQPLTYSKKWRCRRLALLMILVVWLLAFVITCPTMFGWYAPGRNRHQEGYIDCQYNQSKGYVLYSAMGSFFIPLTIMLYVYVKIGCIVKSRRLRIVCDTNTERNAEHFVNVENLNCQPNYYHRTLKKKLPFCEARCSGIKPMYCAKNISCPKGQERTQPLFYELIETSRISSRVHCSADSCRYHVNFSPSLSIQTLCNKNYESTNSTRLGTFNYNPRNHSSKNLHQEQNQLASSRIPMRISANVKNTKTTKTLTIVMGGLVACWMPFFIFYLLIPFLPTLKKFGNLMSLFTWVGWLNCAINPFIYAFNPDFRTAFWRLTCRRLCKKSHSNHMNMFRT